MIKLSSVLVDDQEKALKFYTQTLGFVKSMDIPMGKYRWLTVISGEEPSGAELVLEPGVDKDTIAFKKALREQGKPFNAFQVDDIDKEFTRLKAKGVLFVKEPTKMGPITQAIFDDTCGNLIQIYQVNA